MSVASTQSDRIGGGNVAKLVDRLSKDLSKPNVLAEVNLRKPNSSMHQRAVVRYSYSATHDDELNLKEGDEIDVIEAVEDGWMRGKLNGRVGVFPTNFVTFTSPTSTPTAPKVPEEKKRSNSISSSATASTQNGVENGGSSTHSKASITKSLTFTSRKVTEAAAPATAPVVERNERPFAGDSDLSSFLKGGGVRAKSSIFAADRDTSSASLGPPPPHSEAPKIKEMAKVMYAYKAQHEDELDLPQEGLMITIINKNCADPGWYEGELNGKRGLFPDNFVKLIEVPVERPTVAPPSLPTKPKPPMISKEPPKSDASSASEAGVTSNVRRSLFNPSTSEHFKFTHSKISDQLKISLPGAAPPKFSSKSGSTGESASASNSAGVDSSEPVFREEKDAKLQHLTTNRPKQQKRPPSSMFIGSRKSDDGLEGEIVASNEASLQKEKEVKHVTIAAEKPSTHDKTVVHDKPHIHDKSLAHDKLLVHSNEKTTVQTHFPAGKEAAPLPSKTPITVTPKANAHPVTVIPSAVAFSGESELVSRREYNELLKAFEELSKRVLQLEQRKI